MPNVLIETADGAQYSVVEADYKRHYPDTKYTVIGEETDAAFEVVGVPKPKAPRKRPAAKKTAPKPAPTEPSGEPV